MSLSALIFDLDGTLLDANPLHARAWQEALDAHGYHVGRDRIALEIGKGGSMLVPSLLGREAEEADGDTLRDEHDRRYLALLDDHDVPVFSGVRELFAAVKERGLKTAIATASKKESLEKVMGVAGLELYDLADEVVTDSDVDRSKPNPDVVTAACRKLELSAGQCAMVGDTPYDVSASGRAGVVALGVLTGVHDAEAMRREGARRVYRDVADLHDHLDAAIEAASPTSFAMTEEWMVEVMAEAIDEAQSALTEGDVPIGAVLVRGDGEVVARGHNRTISAAEPLAHAEMEVLQTGLDRVAPGSRDLVLVTTLAPCIMCYGAAMEAHIDTIIYALDAPTNAGTGHCRPARTPDSVAPRIIGGVRAGESRRLLEKYANHRPDTRFLDDLLERV